MVNRKQLITKRLFFLLMMNRIGERTSE